jgi:hypothetical protein
MLVPLPSVRVMRYRRGMRESFELSVCSSADGVTASVVFAERETITCHMDHLQSTFEANVTTMMNKAPVWHAVHDGLARLRAKTTECVEVRVPSPARATRRTCHHVTWFMQR